MTNQELIEAARNTCNPITLGQPDFSAGTVGAALFTADGHVYTGICIDLACGLGFCAEAAAAADMLKHHETHVVKMVAAFADGHLGTPCGRCREMLVQINPQNFDCEIILANDQSITLRELLPVHWLNDN